jgi:hypothetical protein
VRYALPGQDFTLTGKPDRIDMLDDGRLLPDRLQDRRATDRRSRSISTSSCS